MQRLNFLMIGKLMLREEISPSILFTQTKREIYLIHITVMRTLKRVKLILLVTQKKELKRIT